MHLETSKNLKIKESRLLNSLGFPGKKGLYAFTRKRKRRIFKEDDVICSYNGELIDEDELNYRYGNYTGPYAVKISQNRYEDAAIERGVGSMINHSNSTRKINCHLRKRRNKISLVATKNIMNGSELITTYGDKYRFNENVQTSTNSRKKISI
jgi:SET domain-containing protein